MKIKVVEDPLTVLYFHEIGYTFAVVASWAAGLTEVQLRLLVGCCERIRLAFDNDPALEMTAAQIDRAMSGAVSHLNRL